MKSSKMIIGLLIAFFLVNTAGLWMIISETKKQTAICAETAATLSDIQKQNSAIQEELSSLDAIVSNSDLQATLMQQIAELDYMHTTLYLDEVVNSIIDQGLNSVDEFNAKMPYVFKVSELGRAINMNLWEYLHPNKPSGID